MLAVTMLTYLGTGMITRDMLPMFAVVAPAMLVPTLLGTRLPWGSRSWRSAASCWAC